MEGLTKRLEYNAQVNKQKKYYQIIPFVKLPLARNPCFTYFSTKNISAGVVVKIPFASRMVAGMATQTTKKPPFPTREIVSVLENSQITEKQLELAKSISSHYLSPLGVVLKLFFQKLSKKQTAPEFEKPENEKKPAPTAQQLQAIKNIIKAEKNSVFLLFGPASSGKTEVVLRVVEKIISSSKKQALLLIPEIFLAQQELHRYRARFPQEQVVLLHSKIKASELSYIHNNLRNGKIKIVISTRAGLFLPFSSLGIIAMDEEQDVSYKQWDQAPFYHARTVAQELAKIHQAKIVFVSSTPSVQIFDQVQKKEVVLLKLPSLKTPSVTIKKPEIIVVDLLKNFKKKQQISISKEMKIALSECLEKKEISLILVPRKGKSSYVICSDCKKALLCPNCQTLLSHANDVYKCLHCSYKKSTITKCPSCGSFRMVDVGFGTQSIAQELQKNYPSAQISIADSDSFKENSKRKETLQKLLKGEIDILVGTYAIAKGFDIPKISLTGILNADSWPGQSDFGFDEHFLGNLFQLAGRVNRPKSRQNGKCLIQTFYPQSEPLKILKKWNWEIFLEKESHTRSLLAYPPFGKFIKIILTEKSQKKVEKNSKKVYNSLLKIADGNFTVSEPYFGYNKQKRSLWRMNILLKIKGKPDEKTLQKIAKSGSLLKIDVDPENLF